MSDFTNDQLNELFRASGDVDERSLILGELNRRREQANT